MMTAVSEARCDSSTYSIGRPLPLETVVVATTPGMGWHCTNLACSRLSRCGRVGASDLIGLGLLRQVPV